MRGRMEELPFAEGVARIAPCTEHCAARAAARRHRSQDMTRPPASPHLSGLAAADQLGAVTRAAPRRRGPRADLASRPALCPPGSTTPHVCIPTQVTGQHSRRSLCAPRILIITTRVRWHPPLSTVRRERERERERRHRAGHTQYFPRKRLGPGNLCVVCVAGDYWILIVFFCIPYMTCSLEWLTDNDTNHHAAQLSAAPQHGAERTFAAAAERRPRPIGPAAVPPSGPAARPAAAHPAAARPAAAHPPTARARSCRAGASASACRASEGGASSASSEDGASWASASRASWASASLGGSPAGTWAAVVANPSAVVALGEAVGDASPQAGPSAAPPGSSTSARCSS